MIGRFLYAVPRNVLGKRKIHTEPISEATVTSYRDLLRALLSTNGTGTIKFSKDAMLLFDEWKLEIENMLGKSGRLRKMLDWGGKLAGLTARLAAVLHSVEFAVFDPWDCPVPIHTVRDAITIAKWSNDHAEAALAIMSGGKPGCRKISKFLSDGKSRFNIRDIRDLFKNDTDGMWVALKGLTQKGWIRPAPAKSTKGRKRVNDFDVNPSLRFEMGSFQPPCD